MEERSECGKQSPIHRLRRKKAMIGANIKKYLTASRGQLQAHGLYAIYPCHAKGLAFPSHYRLRSTSDRAAT